MASGKYERKTPTKIIKNYHKFESQPYVKGYSQGKYLEEKQTPKFNAPKGTKRRILAFIAAGLIFNTISSKAPDEITSVEKMPSNKSILTQEDSLSKTEKIYTIGIANYDTEITVDGQKYPIGDSFVIAFENEVIVSDVHGNFLKGQLDDSSFKKVAHISESEMEDYHYFKIISDIDANVRSSGEISDDNIISTAHTGDYVLGLKARTPEYDGEWIKTISINDGQLNFGYIREDIVQEVGTIEAVNYKTEQNMQNIDNLVIVDTSKDEYINLNMRLEPGKDVIAEIPYGSFVEILGETMQYGNKSWVQVKYESPDGNEFQGWVASKYLTTNPVKEKPGPKIINGVHVNSSGTVTGIDISTLSPNVLREVLESGVSEQSGSVHGNFDTSQIAGKVNYAYIKLGASTYGQGDFNVIDYNNYIEQVKICEELGVPYGFYYYSTAKTVEESMIELDCIKERIEDLRQKFNLENNLLEIAVDIELTDTNDRQYQGDIYEQTQAKAALINGILEENLCDHVLIYGPGRVMQPDLDQIFDLELLYSLLEKPDSVYLWQCSLMNSNGELKADLKNDIAYGEKCGFSTTACQTGLDIYVKSNNKIVGLIDVNEMNFEHFMQLTKREIKIENDKIFYTLEFDTENNNNEISGIALKDNSQVEDELEL